MKRIFSVLALFALLFMVATAGLGLSLGDVRNPRDRATQRWATVHRLSGVAAGLAVLLAEGIAITWFVGTSRWCQEVAEPYHLDRDLVVRSHRLKRGSFPWAVASILIAIGVVAQGGAADPAASLQLRPLGGFTWAQLHLLGALGGIALIAWSCWVQYERIAAQTAIIEHVLAQVREIRKRQGLE